MFGVTWPQVFLVLVMFAFAGWLICLLVVDASNDALREEIEEDVLAHVVDVALAFAREQDDAYLRELALELADRLADRLDEEVPDHGS